MRDLINFCFKVEKQFNVVTKFGPTWTDDKIKFMTTFDKASLKLAINFLLDDCFLILVNSPFNISLE